MMNLPVARIVAGRARLIVDRHRLAPVLAQSCLTWVALASGKAIEGGPSIKPLAS
jgi:hypothetical protein